MINTRLFGSPIDPKVREELDYRQGNTLENTSEVAPGDSINNSQRKEFRIDDKTPFVRMWAGVKIIEPASLVLLMML